MESAAKINVSTGVAMTLFDTERKRLDSVEYAMSGYYQCVIANSRANMSERRFITSHLHLIVIEPPTMGQIVSSTYRA